MKPARLAMTLVSFALAVLVWIPGRARPARAEAACPAAVYAWLRDCEAQTGLSMSASSCPGGATLVAVTATDGTSLLVEIGDRPGAFRPVGALGISPVGEFPDWKLEPAPRRAAFDALASCVARSEGGASALSHAAPESPSPAPRALRTPWPWPLLLACIAACASYFAAPGARLSRLARIGVAAAASIALTLLVRRLFASVPFFHQNGQGPLWIEFAARGDAGAYGPGYPELFHLVARSSSRPERAVVQLQELLAACVPLSLYAVARGVGARRSVAALAFLWAALDPCLARLARTEAYFATFTSLVCLAAAMVPRATDPRVDRRARVAATVAAALLVAQAARVHPLSWVPAALLPAIALLVPGRRPLSRALLLAVGIAAIVAVVDLPELLGSLRGELGRGFLPGAAANARHRAALALLAVAGSAALVLHRRTRRPGRAILVLTLVASAAALADVLARDARPSDLAYLHAYAPGLVAGLAALMRGRSVGPAVAGLAGLAGVAALHAWHDHRTLVVPTDVLEQTFCLEWREALPRTGQVVWIARADRRVLELPLLGADLPSGAPIRSGVAPRLEAARPRFYYRGSLCSTPEGAPLCQRFERAHRLRTIAARTLPAVHVVPWLPLGPEPIRVELFALE